MKQKELVKKIDFMIKCEFFTKKDITWLNLEINKWIESVDEHFGDNDGEKFDGEDSVKFISELLRLRLLDSFAVLQE